MINMTSLLDEQVGGPSWTVKLGRRDSTTAGSQSLAERDLPRGSDDLSTLQSLFSRKGFSSRELVALSGLDPSSVIKHNNIDQINMANN